MCTLYLKCSIQLHFFPQSLKKYICNFCISQSLPKYYPELLSWIIGNVNHLLSQIFISGYKSKFESNKLKMFPAGGGETHQNGARADRDYAVNSVHKTAIKSFHGRYCGSCEQCQRLLAVMHTDTCSLCCLSFRLQLWLLLILIQNNTAMAL